MGDVASSLISASTEEVLREAACGEGSDNHLALLLYTFPFYSYSHNPLPYMVISETVKHLTGEYRLALAQALFLSVLEEREGTKGQKIKWKLKRRTWKSYNRYVNR